MSAPNHLHTFYLTKDLSSHVKRLSDLKEDWQREVAKLLLNTSLDSRTMASEIHGVTKWAGQTKQGEGPEAEETMRVTLEMLPKGMRGRARILLHHLLPRVRLGDGDVVELPGQGPTAPLIDVVRYFASPFHLKVAPPERLSVLRHFFRHHHFPKSAFGPGRLDSPPNTPSSVNNPWISL